MKKTTILLLSTALLSFMSHAENGIRLNVQGSSTIEVPHEFVDFNVTVDTRCGTADEVEAQNRTQVAQVTNFLQNIIADTGLTGKDNNWVRTSSSSLQEYSNTVYAGEKRVEICGGTFRVQTRITFRTTARDEAFNNVNRSYLTGMTGFTMSAGARDSLATVIEASAADAGICEETRISAASRAYDNAWINVWNQIDKIADACGFSEERVRVLSVNAPTARYERTSSLAYASAPMMNDGSFETDATPVYLAPIQVSYQVSVEAEGPQTYCQRREDRAARMMSSAR